MMRFRVDLQTQFGMREIISNIFKLRFGATFSLNSARTNKFSHHVLVWDSSHLATPHSQDYVRSAIPHSSCANYVPLHQTAQDRPAADNTFAADWDTRILLPAGTSPCPSNDAAVAVNPGNKR